MASNTVSILVATAGNGTAAQFTTSRIPCAAFFIQAASTNTAAVYFGDQTTKASTATGLYIPAPATAVPAPPIGPFFLPAGPEGVNLQEWWADSASASQKLIILYQTA